MEKEEKEATPALAASMLPKELVEPFNGEEMISKEEAEAESMIGLMEEIRNAKDINPTLNDEERRQNAERIMMKLASMMDLGSDDEDLYGDEEII